MFHVFNSLILQVSGKVTNVAKKCVGFTAICDVQDNYSF